MLTEARQDFLVELHSRDGGFSILPSPSSVPKAHRFQGGLIYSRLIDIEGRVLAPQVLAGRPIRVWLSQLEKWRLVPHEAPDIGDIYDRTGELADGGLEATLYIPKEAWLTAVDCLSTIWRRLSLTGADGNGREMRLVAFSFSTGGLTRP